MQLFDHGHSFSGVEIDLIHKGIKTGIAGSIEVIGAVQ